MSDPTPADPASADAFAAIVTSPPTRGLVFALTPPVLDAGEALLDPARAKASASRTVSADAADILAGNAALALDAPTPDRAAAAVCLGALVRHTGSRAIVAVVKRIGDDLDCEIERLDAPEAGAARGAALARVTRRVAALLKRAPSEIGVGQIVDAAP
jgi:sugar (pentulose or hexulose) kinase